MLLGGCQGVENNKSKSLRWLHMEARSFVETVATSINVIIRAGIRNPGQNFIFAISRDLSGNISGVHICDGIGRKSLGDTDGKRILTK
jgi:hypothetical protein